MWSRIFTVLLKSQMNYVSSDEESDGDKDSKEDTRYKCIHGKKITIPCLIIYC